MALKRFLLIAWLVIRYRLDSYIQPALLPWPARLLYYLMPWHYLPSDEGTRAQRLRLLLEQLGPIFIKFGQMLSTRRDLLPDDIADELAKLQDQVAPFDPKQAKQLIESSLGQPVEQLFAEFDTQPLASASIAQVHCAKLPDCQEVVVKVVRPGIEKVIRSDIRLLEFLAKLIQNYHPEGFRLRPVEVVEDYKHTILDELDLQREAANTQALRRNFDNSELLYVPQVHWDYCRRNVLVMERIYGIPCTDTEALTANGTNMKLLAERGVEIFFTQVFRDSFFHADMHPGNIFISTEHPENPQYIAIDCAIIGSLSEPDLYYLARNLLAIFQRDYRLVAQLHVECGWVPADTKVPEFEAAMRSVCEPIFEKPLAEISFGHLLMYLFQTARRFNMEVQPSLVLLQKTLLNIEGLGRQLYPELDLWDTAKPYLERWLVERYSPKNALEQLKKHGPGWLEQLPQLPDQILARLNQAPPSPATSTPPETKNNSDKWALALALIALLSASESTWQQIQNLPPLSIACGGLALLLWWRR